MVSTPEIFAARLLGVAADIERRADELEEKWGERTAEEMRRRVPRRSGDLARSIRQVEPGGIEIGEDYWFFVDRGTANMPPQEFVRPSVNSQAPGFRREALDAGVDWIA